MNGMGDIRVDEHAPSCATSARRSTRWRRATCTAPPPRSRRPTSRALIEDEDARFEIDPRLSAEEREDHARMQLGLERLLRDGGYGAYSTHFGAIAEDGRFARLPLAAASSLMAKGFGYAAEGDAADRRADVRRAGPARRRRSSPRCTRWTSRRDSILMSHMGEGNWALARERPAGAADQAPARDRRRSTTRRRSCSSTRTGPATLATSSSLGGERFRLVVAEGEILDTDELPALEMPYGFFRPDIGPA